MQHFRGGSRAAATSKMEYFVIIVNGFQPLTIITKHSNLDVAAVPDPPLLQDGKDYNNIKIYIKNDNMIMTLGNWIENYVVREILTYFNCLFDHGFSLVMCIASFSFNP